MAGFTRWNSIVDQASWLLGDIAEPYQWDREALYWAARAVLDRYGQVFERTEVQCIQLPSAGRFGLSLQNWAGDKIAEVVYLHWPAQSTVAATTGENKIIDWWYSPMVSTNRYDVTVDIQVEGTTFPAQNDYILVRGALQHHIAGMETDYYGSTNVAAYSSVPEAHEGLIAIGVCAYCFRMRQSSMAIKAGSEPGFASPYHVNLLADLAEKFNTDFERELAILADKRLFRPPFGMPERKQARMRESVHKVGI